MGTFVSGPNRFAERQLSFRGEACHNECSERWRGPEAGGSKEDYNREACRPGAKGLLGLGSRRQPKPGRFQILEDHTVQNGVVVDEIRSKIAMPS